MPSRLDMEIKLNSRLRQLHFVIVMLLTMVTSDLDDTFRRRHITVTKLSFLRSVLCSMGYNPTIRSTGPDTSVPILLPWILTQVRRERENLAMNDSYRLILARAIHTRMAEEVEVLEKIKASDALIEACKAASDVTGKESKEVESVSDGEVT
ncbi:hypothetical protein DFP73DRAFT_529805 [Morchella snyderi]|nr:hypothetical protein DFP73DRAFT_529805 [Morchella snyderi]